MVSSFSPLEAGEPIGVAALSGPVDAQRLRAGVEALQRWGHPVLVAPNVGADDGYTAGSDDERLAGLEWLLERGARVVVAARGGYGATRLLSRLDWSELARRGVTFVGFSDLTAILNPLWMRGGVVQVHGPMAAAGLDRPGPAGRLAALLRGDLVGGSVFRIPPRAVVRPGVVTGTALGGNLALLTSLLGTPFEVDLRGGVLFLEEVGEPLYRLDRMLTHLAASATFPGVKALMGGSLRGCRPARPTAAGWRRMLAEAAPPGAVVVAGLPFGHGADNRAFPIGATVQVDTDRGLVAWSG